MKTKQEQFEEYAMRQTMHGIAMKHCAYCENINRYTMDSCDAKSGNRINETDTCQMWKIESSFKHFQEVKQ